MKTITQATASKDVLKWAKESRAKEKGKAKAPMKKNHNYCPRVIAIMLFIKIQTAEIQKEERGKARKEVKARGKVPREVLGSKSLLCSATV